MSVKAPAIPLAPRPHPASVSPSDFADACAVIAEMVRMLTPTAEQVWIGYRTPQGREGTIPLEVFAAQAIGEDGLTDAQRTILNVFRQSPVPLTRKQAAMAANYSSAEGRFGVEIRPLLSKGKLLKRGSEYTDDPSKFVGTN